MGQKRQINILFLVLIVTLLTGCVSSWESKIPQKEDVEEYEEPTEGNAVKELVKEDALVSDDRKEIISDYTGSPVIEKMETFHFFQRKKKTVLNRLNDTATLMRLADAVWHMRMSVRSLCRRKNAVKSGW